MLGRLINKIHNNYISRVESGKKKIINKEWSTEKIDGYVLSYFNHGFPLIRSLFGELPILGEPALIEACIEESSHRKLRGYL